MISALVISTSFLFLASQATFSDITNLVAAHAISFSTEADAVLAEAYRTNRRWCWVLLHSGTKVGPLMLQAFEEDPDRYMLGFLLTAYEGSDGYFCLLKLLRKRRISGAIEMDTTPMRFRQVMSRVISMEYLIDAACMDNTEFAMEIMASVEVVNLEIVYEAIRLAGICRTNHLILKRLPLDSWMVLNRVACEYADMVVLVLLVMRKNPLGLLRKLDGLMYQWEVDVYEFERMLNLALQLDSSYAPQLIGMSACVAYTKYEVFDRMLRQWIDHLTIEQLDLLRTLLFLRVGGHLIDLIDQRLQI